LATAVIAFAPARDRLQRWVDRRLYGEPHDPVRAMARLGERLRDTPGSAPGGDVLTGCWWQCARPTATVGQPALRRGRGGVVSVARAERAS
jgi:hypothetical protein